MPRAERGTWRGVARAWRLRDELPCGHLCRYCSDCARSYSDCAAWCIPAEEEGGTRSLVPKTLWFPTGFRTRSSHANALPDGLSRQQYALREGCFPPFFTNPGQPP
ncbi:hypothetical protein GCM10009801_08740 [Streptomyces albiaxialis]|uniref:Uncharacterized protein n=1 Tax=Streptomyces albiaxialis TaxID=329523 RepID=A0ABP5H730_9ACTN